MSSAPPPVGSDREDGNVVQNPSIASSETSYEKVQYAGDAKSTTSTGKRITRQLWFAILAVFLACMCNGWTLGGAGGPFTMDSFRQYMDWDINCRPNPENLDCSVVIASSNDIWTGDDTCWDCCCEKNPNSNETDETSQIASFASWGAAVGAIFTSPMSEYLGRKRSVQIACLVMTIGSIMQMSTTSMGPLIAGRWINGMAMGCLLPLGPMYLSEITPVDLRGYVASGGQMALVTGQFFASVANIWLPYSEIGWRFSYGTPAFFAVIAIGCIFAVPESPRWLYLKGKEDKCKQVMNLIRSSPNEIQREMEIFEKFRLQSTKTVPFWEVFKPYHLWKTLTTLCLHTFQQFSGILVTTNFSPTLYSIFYGPEVASYSFVAFNVVRVLVLIIGIALTERMGRVKQLVMGAAIMTLGQFCIAMCAVPYNYDGPPSADFPDGTPPYLNNEGLAITVIIMSYVYVAGYSLGWGNLPFVVTAEYLRNDIRGHGMGIGSVVVWITGGITTSTYPYMSSPDSMDLYGTYLYYTVWTILATIFTMCCLMETAGLPIEQVQNELDDFKQNYKFGIQTEQIRASKRKELPTTI